jgi:hypothetical protein
VVAIRAEQADLVTRAHQVAIYLADLGVSAAQTAVMSDQLRLQTDQAQAAATAEAADGAQNRLASDQVSLSAAAAANQAAQGRLALDRDQLRGLALGVYTGAFTGPQPATLDSLGAEQEADIGRGEAEIVADVVVKNLHTDVTGARSTGRQYRRAQAAVSDDHHQLAVDRTAAAIAAARVPPDLSALAVAQRRLASAQQQLEQAHAELTAALTAVLGPAGAGTLSAGAGRAAGGLSVLGTSALNVAQLLAWFNAQGYTDLTSTPIAQLIAWYIQTGAVEGVRGDVAFAQAMLETGGFSSSDAVDLNNYAGIGHCDSCAAGWPFPSPHGGVIGHLQLLRIFATSALAPRGAPPPVLPVLTPAKQSRAGCCPTWESLTGMWATDPLYALSVLSIYESMLAFAASLPTPAPAGVGAGNSSSATSAGPTPPSAGPVSTSGPPASGAPARASAQGR